MFVVAYLGLLSASVQFATVAQKAQAPFDVAAAQYAMATISQYYIYVGWFALRPLFQAFGLSEIADLTSWLLLVANFVGYPLLAAILIRTGYATGGLMVGVAGVGLVVAVL